MRPHTHEQLREVNLMSTDISAPICWSKLLTTLNTKTKIRVILRNSPGINRSSNPQYCTWYHQLPMVTPEYRARNNPLNTSDYSPKPKSPPTKKPQLRKEGDGGEKKVHLKSPCHSRLFYIPGSGR